jgi:fructosamine-3-kinase
VNIAGVELRDVRLVGGGDICTAYCAVTGDGTRVFAKTHEAPPERFFAAEAAGLDLLRLPSGPPVPEVVAVADDGLVLLWVEPGHPTVAAARAFGTALARMHAASMPSFGASADGFIGPLPLPNAPSADWPTFYVEHRLRPYVAALTLAQRRDVDAVCARIDDLAGLLERPARIHGDLWSGNVLWAADGHVWLIDAASAHGGHRETDLAMLAWFGAPHLDEIIAAYVEQAPLAPGWRERVALHQLHPMLVHATLFGGGYGARAAAAARSLLRS